MVTEEDDVPNKLVELIQQSGIVRSDNILLFDWIGKSTGGMESKGDMLMELIVQGGGEELVSLKSRLSESLDISLDA